jgi:nuclear pore complex protein Nup160
MDTAYFDRLISLEPPIPTDPLDNSDISLSFIQHLFYPGRFSMAVLDTALTDYLSQPGRRLVPQLSAASPSLSGRFEAVVGCDIEMAIDSHTGAPIVDAYREAMKRDWLSIWARVKDLDKHSRWPLATTTIDGHVMIYTRAGLSAYVPEAQCALVDRSGDTEDGQVIIELPESAFSNVYPLLEADIRRAVITTSMAGSYIVKRLDEQESAEGSGTVLEDILDHIDNSLASPETEPIESRAEALWDGMIEPYFGEDDQLALRRIVSNTATERDAVSHTLDLLAEAVVDEHMDDTADSNRNFSGNGNALLTSTIASTIQSRYALSRKVLLVALYHLAESGTNGEDEESEDVLSLINRAFCIYHRYRVLQWVSEQTGEEGSIRHKNAKVTKRNEGEEGNSVQIRNKHQDGLQNDGTDSSYSLLHSLLCSKSTSSPNTGFSFLYDAAQKYLGQVDLVDSDLVEVEPRNQDVVLAHSVLMDGHADTARRLTELYPLSSGTSYVRARSLVKLGAFEESVDLFKQAVNGCRGEYLLSSFEPR